MKGIVDITRNIADDYLDKEKREKAMKYFRHSLFERINSVAKYVRLKTLDCEKMVCSLLYLARGIEGLLFEALQKRMNKKYKQYKKVALQTPEEIYSAIETSIEDEYELNENTTIMVIDNIRKTSYPLSLNKKDRDYINEFISISKGAELFNLIYNTEKERESEVDDEDNKDHSEHENNLHHSESEVENNLDHSEDEDELENEYIKDHSENENNLHHSESEVENNLDHSEHELENEFEDNQEQSEDDSEVENEEDETSDEKDYYSEDELVHLYK